MRGTGLTRSKTRAAVALGAAASACLLTACSSSGARHASNPASSAASSSASTPASTGSPVDQADLYAYTGSTPPQSGPAAAKGKTVWIVSCGQSVPGCASATTSVVDAAKAIGWKTLVCDGHVDVNDGYGTCITQGIASHVSAMILTSGFDCDVIRPQLQSAKAAGIPVVANFSVDCDDPLSTVKAAALFTPVLLSQQYPTAQRWMYARGQAIGKYIIAKTGGKANIIDEYFDGLLLGTYQHHGLLDELKTCSGCKVIASVAVTGAIQAKGQDHQLMESAAVAHPNANVIAFGFSSFVLSSQLASVATQLGDHPLVVGGEGNPATLALLRAGSVPSAEAAYNLAYVGWAAVDELNRVFAGQPAVPEGVGWEMVDKTHNLPAANGSYVATPSDFRPIYLKSWGLAG